MKKNYLSQLIVATVCIAAVIIPAGIHAQVINTIAGTGTAAYSGDGAAATAAEISKPGHVILDTSGNLYIADHDNNRIRKISTTGIITTIAGDGTAGFGGDGAAATAAKLNKPNGIAFDGAGNLYICDENNNRIRKIDVGGIITTIAGTGSAGYAGDGSAATAAQLYHPSGIAIDPLDPTPSIYIAEGPNHVIRYINASGIINTIVGTHVSGFSGDGGSSMTAQLNFPYDVALDSGGVHLYIADAGNNRVRKLTGLTISTIAGTGTGAFYGDAGPATAAFLNYPATLMVDATGNVYVGDGANNRIRKIDLTGIITTVVGNGTPGFSGDGGNPLLASVFYPGGTAMDDSGNLYIADANNHRIRKVTPAVSTGIEHKYLQNQSASGISIFPNPASSAINISLPAGPATVTLYDNTGRTVLAKTILMAAAGHATLGVEILPSGNYIIKTHTGNNTYRSKLVIEK